MSEQPTKTYDFGSNLDNVELSEITAATETDDQKPAVEEAPKVEEEVIKAKVEELKKPEVLGTVDLNPKPKKG